MDSALNSHGSSLFLPSGGGCGKTYLAKLIAAGIHARDKIVLCTASTSLTALLLPGGCTAHSQFKIPILCHEQSTVTVFLSLLPSPYRLIISPSTYGYHVTRLPM